MLQRPRANIPQYGSSAQLVRGYYSRKAIPCLVALRIYDSDVEDDAYYKMYWYFTSDFRS